MADLRSKTQDLMQTGFSKLGMSDANALKYAQDFAGRPDADTILASLGVLDLTPAGLVFGTQDAYRDFKKAETPTDYAIATGMLGLSGLEAFPATKGIAKYAKNLIKPKTGALPDNVDLSKRQTVKTLGALPVAAVVADPVVGALSKLGDAPVAKTVAKTVAKAVPSNTFSNLMRNLYAGIVPNQNTAKLLKSENQEFIIDLEMGGAKDGIFESDWHKQSYENYKEIDNVLDKQIKNNEYPSKLNFSESATEQYNESLIDNIYDRYGVGEDVDLDIAQMWKDEFGVELTPSNMTNTDIRDAITTSAIDRQNLTKLPENVVEFPLTTRTIDTD